MVDTERRHESIRVLASAGESVLRTFSVYHQLEFPEIRS